MENKVYPVSEIFTSPQGEGQFTGALMTFIRLAGCSVGKPYPKEVYQEKNCTCGNYHQHSPNCEKRMYTPLPIYTEMCTLYDGREFACDTDYRVNTRLSVKEIVNQIPPEIDHVCITGGEPFIHDLIPLVMAIEHHGATAHVETSGTRSMNKAFPTESDGTNLWSEDVWITVSPKLGILTEMINRANEIKLLIDENFSISRLPQEIINHDLVYIQPVNGEWTVDGKNLKRVMELQKQFPKWRVSVQLHKVLSHYMEELVR